MFPLQGKGVTLVITSQTTGPDFCPPIYEVPKLGSAREGDSLQSKQD